MTLDDFGNLVVSSGLVTAGRESAFRTESHAESALAYAAFLVAKRVLTDWQCQKLFTGKYKGFIIGRYKLLSHLDDGTNYSRYSAEELHTGTPAILRFFPGPPTRCIVEPPNDGSPNPN
jgi:hypothetical protein